MSNHLKNVGICIDDKFDSGVDGPLGHYFTTRASFISSYLRKRLKKDKIDIGYDQLIVYLTQKEPFGITTSNVPNRVIEFRVQASTEMLDGYLKYTDVEKYEFYLRTLEMGYQSISSSINQDLSLLFTYHSDFRNLNYKNTWIMKKKRISSHGLSLFFLADFSSLDFKLVLHVLNSKTKQEIAQKVIFRTFPDVIFYMYNFKYYDFTEKELIVSDSFHDTEITFSYDDLKNGIINNTILNEYTKRHHINDEDIDIFLWHEPSFTTNIKFWKNI